MARTLFYRNVRARGLLELFLVTAITSLLLVRFYLHLTGYPQIGGDGLHIAHMLWGGLLMLSGLTVAFSFLGNRAQRVAALLGGAGFGIFIDELGKFITHDNNYFFQPTIGIIYAIFVGLYLIFNFLSRQQRLTRREYHLNALMQLEEAIEQDMDPNEKARVRDLLEKADPQHPMTRRLLTLLEATDTASAEPPNRLQRWTQAVDTWYGRFWQRRNSEWLVRAFFVAEAALFVLSVFGVTYANVDDLGRLLRGESNYDLRLLVGQTIAAGVAGLFAVYGAVRLRFNRLEALEQFRRATLINLFLTEFFVFARVQFAALPGFLFNLGLLGLLTYARRQEHRARYQARARAVKN